MVFHIQNDTVAQKQKQNKKMVWAIFLVLLWFCMDMVLVSLHIVNALTKLTQMIAHTPETGFKQT